MRPALAARSPYDAPSSQQLFLGRQSIVDRGQNLVAFELLFRSSLADAADVKDDFAATTTVINHAFNELGLGSVLGKYRGFIKLNTALLMSDVIEVLPRDQVVLDILGRVELSPSVIERCRQLKAQGFSLALNDRFYVSPEMEHLAAAIDFIKIDIFEADNADVRRIVRELKQLPVQLLAKKVDSRQKAKLCTDLGFDLFQGYYFARPQIITGKRTPHSHAMLMRLLGVVLADGDIGEIEELLKLDPGLTANLMLLVNSAATGARREITSPRDAVMLLGRRQLQRSLQLLLYANSAASNEFPDPLLQLVATRGKLMELLAAEMPACEKEFSDRAFMTGIMSLVDVLVGQPIQEILAALSLAPEVKAAILQRSGPLGSLLLLAEKLDKGDMAGLAAVLLEFPHLQAARLNALQAEAMRWANSMGVQAD
jgi:EAL and modified HD-GYP domain-containing signal transduction protein